MCFDEFKEFCKSLIPIISSVTHKYYRTDFAVDQKQDKSPVTIADKLIEEKIREEIEKRFSDHSICGEEFGETRKNSPFEWIIDPIDGTKSFISGVPLFASLIGLLKEGIPLYGCIYNPILDDLVFGDNKSCIVNGVNSRIRDCINLSNAVIVSTDHVKIGRVRNKFGFEKLLDQCKFFRSWGDAYGYALLARGGVDIMVDPKMSRWDILPIIPIMRGAGACISDYFGGAPEKGDSIVVSHPRFHQTIIDCLNNNR